MTSLLLSHLIKSFLRSPSLGRDVSTRVALGVIVVTVIGFSLPAAFALESIIVNVLKEVEPVVFLNRILIYYFVSEFVTRYFFQNLPVLNIVPYLHLPLPKNAITKFMLCRSMVHLLNIMVFFCFAPFALTAVAKTYGTSYALCWLLSLWFVSMACHFALVVLKKVLDDNGWILVALLAVVALIFVCDYSGLLPLSAISEKAFMLPLQHCAYTLAFLLLPIFGYIAAFYSSVQNIYPPQQSTLEVMRYTSHGWNLLPAFGTIGAWINLETNLILRHKRTRSVFLIGIPFLCSLLIICSRIKNPQAYGAFLSFGIMGTGMVMINYGQFLFSWQARHFDFTLTRPVALRQYVVSKYWLLVAITTFWLMASMVLAYFDRIYVLTNLVAFLYNLGVNIFMIMNMSMWGARKIDLEANGTWNYEGMGAAQWLISLPFLAGPFIFYLPFSLAGYPFAGLAAVAAAGLAGFLFRNTLIDITTRRLFAMRYTVASNFRKD